VGVLVFLMASAMLRFALSCDAEVVCFCFRWHPRGAFAAQALPLCGAALTFFAAAKKVSKESGLTPPAPVPA